MKIAGVITIIILIAAILASCAPEGVVVDGSGSIGIAEPVMKTYSGNIYKYEDTSNGIVCYFTTNELECFER